MIGARDELALLVAFWSNVGAAAEPEEMVGFDLFETIGGDVLRDGVQWNSYQACGEAGRAQPA